MTAAQQYGKQILGKMKKLPPKKQPLMTPYWLRLRYSNIEFVSKMKIQSAIAVRNDLSHRNRDVPSVFSLPDQLETVMVHTTKGYTLAKDLPSMLACLGSRPPAL